MLLFLEAGSQTIMDAETTPSDSSKEIITADSESSENTSAETNKNLPPEAVESPLPDDAEEASQVTNEAQSPVLQNDEHTNSSVRMTETEEAEVSQDAQTDINEKTKSTEEIAESNQQSEQPVIKDVDDEVPNSEKVTDPDEQLEESATSTNKETGSLKVVSDSNVQPEESVDIDQETKISDSNEEHDVTVIGDKAEESPALDSIPISENIDDVGSPSNTDKSNVDENAQINDKEIREIIEEEQNAQSNDEDDEKSRDGSLDKATEEGSDKMDLTENVASPTTFEKASDFTHVNIDSSGALTDDPEITEVSMGNALAETEMEVDQGNDEPANSGENSSEPMEMEVDDANKDSESGKQHEAEVTDKVGTDKNQEPENTEFIQITQDKQDDAHIDGTSMDAEDPFGGDNLTSEITEQTEAIGEYYQILAVCKTLD